VLSVDLALLVSFRCQCILGLSPTFSSNLVFVFSSLGLDAVISLAWSVRGTIIVLLRLLQLCVFIV
jgi:hypothetical protein